MCFLFLADCKEILGGKVIEKDSFTISKTLKLV